MLYKPVSARISGMTGRLGLGVVGLGRIGRVHAEIIRLRLEKAELVAVSDVVEELSRGVASRLGVKYYTSYDRLLKDPGVEAVVISTPTHLHKDMVVRALEENKHVFVEKPLTVSSREAEEIVRKVRKSGLVLQLGYMRRFDYAYRRAKKEVSEGVVGRPLSFISIARDPVAPPGWASDPRLSGGIFLDMLSHDFDMARWLLSDEVVEVYVNGGSYLYDEVREKGDLDVVNIMFRTSGGVQGFVHGARKNVFGYELRTEVYGSEGTVYVGSSHDPNYAAGTSRGVVYQGVSWFETRFYEAYVEELKSFVESVLRDQEPLVTAVDGLRASQIAEACWESYEKRAPVRVAY